jgi:PAS domain S-box-containing protein
VIDRAFPMKRSDGSVFVGELSAERLGSASGREILVAIRDITERRQAEEALQVSEERLRLAGKATSDVVWDWDVILDTQRWNEAGTAVFGWTEIVEHPVSAQWWVDRVHADDRQRVHDSFFAVVDDPDLDVWQDDYRFMRADGAYADVMDRGYVLRDEQGKAVRMIGAMLDITARKRAEEEIRKLNAELERRVVERTAQLEASNEELEAFAYSVSHDLRAPLRAVDGYTSILAEDYGPGLDEEGRRLCSAISRGARTMGTLIDELLALSRLGRTELAPSVVDMHALAQAVFLELADEEETRRRVDFRLAPLPDALADRTLVHQVWLNLLDNALKFSSQREGPVIEVGCLPAGAAAGPASEDIPEGGAGPVYFVRDNGAGFDMAYADKLFGVFQRLHGDREFPGTGVGLATVQRIVRRHGGRVWAQAEPGQGATFFFSLPSCPPPAEPG